MQHYWCCPLMWAATVRGVNLTVSCYTSLVAFCMFLLHWSNSVNILLQCCKVLFFLVLFIVRQLHQLTRNTNNCLHYLLPDMRDSTLLLTDFGLLSNSHWFLQKLTNLKIRSRPTDYYIISNLYDISWTICFLCVLLCLYCTMFNPAFGCHTPIKRIVL